MHGETERNFAQYRGVASVALSIENASAKDRMAACVSGLETTNEFTSLVRSTGQAFKRDEFELQIHGKWEMHVGAFFRQSGVYSSLARGEVLEPPKLFTLYCEAFEADTVTIRYLAPLEFVDFDGGSIDFGQFQIRRFSRGELDALFQNSVRQTFYPWAVADSAVLADYWLLSAQESLPRSASVGWNITSARVGISYSEHPPVVQIGMQQLALFNWGRPFAEIPQEPRPKKRQEWDGPFLPRIPFVVRVSDSLIDRPHGVVELARLSREPVFDSETGDEVGDEPARGYSMDAAETEKFRKFVRTTSDLIATLKRYRVHWQFLDTALGFLLKAYTTEGLEQLLWHITAIEAVLGQRGAGLSERLLSRVSNILGTTAEDQKGFRRRFDELYEFRSGLVHGRADLADKEIYLGHLGEARDFARSAVLWMLNYLARVAESLSPDTTDIPTRDDLISVIDLDTKKRQQITKLLGVVPPEFPSVTDWL